jgi:fatty-acyl-CoA synthase
MKRERVGAPNPVENDPRAPVKPGSPWSGRRVAEINAETCPGARPVPKMVPVERVRQVLEGKGLTVFGSAPWMVEATAESTWFGFKDDVVVRMGPTRTDVRSISRVGVSDLGMNCKRVTEIVEALSK